MDKDELKLFKEDNLYLNAYIEWLENYVLILYTDRELNFESPLERVNPLALRETFYDIVETDDNYSHLRIKEEE